MQTPSEPSAQREPGIAEIEQWLTEQLAAEAAVDPAQIDIHQPIASYGVDSMQVVSLLAGLEDRLGFRFSTNPLDDHPTIAALAQFVVNTSGRQNH